MSLEDSAARRDPGKAGTAADATLLENEIGSRRRQGANRAQRGCQNKTWSQAVVPWYPAPLREQRRYLPSSTKLSKALWRRVRPRIRMARLVLLNF